MFIAREYWLIPLQRNILIYREDENGDDNKEKSRKRKREKITGKLTVKKGNQVKLVKRQAYQRIAEGEKIILGREGKDYRDADKNIDTC
jgi:hypothetical protein